MPTDLDYQANSSVVLNASGAGTITFNGPGSLTTRTLSTLVISTAPATPRPSAVVYRSSVAPNRRMAATRVADSDTFVADGEVLATGEPLIVVVTGGAVGAVCNVNAFGTDHRA